MRRRPRRAAVPRSGGSGAHRRAGAARADSGRRVPVGAASQPAQGIQRRVCGVSAVSARRRPVHDGLEGVRAHGSPLCEAIRGRDQSARAPAVGCQRVDELWVGRDDQARIWILSGGLTGVSHESPARRGRTDDIRRQDAGSDTAQHTARPFAIAAAHARPSEDRHEDRRRAAASSTRRRSRQARSDRTHFRPAR